MSKEPEGNMKTISHEIWNINKEIDILEKQPNRNFEVEKHSNLKKKYVRGVQLQK